MHLAISRDPTWNLKNTGALNEVDGGCLKLVCSISFEPGTPIPACRLGSSNNRQPVVSPPRTITVQNGSFYLSARLLQDI